MVPGFGYGGGGGGGGAWWGKDEDGGGPSNEGGGGQFAEYPDDDFIPGFGASTTVDVANRQNGHFQPPQQQQQDSTYGGGEERAMDEFGRDRDAIGSRSASAGNNDDWGRGGARSARFGPRRGGRY